MLRISFRFGDEQGMLTLLYAVPEFLQICFANCVLAVPLISLHGSKDPPTLLLSAHLKVIRNEGPDHDGIGNFIPLENFDRARRSLSVGARLRSKVCL